ncbi:MAG TPA: ATP-binding protein [Bryobacteraceae bacterium]|nr:ATP-binding protein [Bryobacteraceae bacterium]
MRNSFRLRLTLWWVGALTVLLAAFSLGVYSLLARSERDRFDGVLRAAGEVTAMSVNHELEEHNGREAGEPSIREVLQTMHQVSFGRQSIGVFAGTREVARKPGTEGWDGAGPDMEPGFHERGEFRTYVMDAPVPAFQGAYRVVVAQSTRTLEEELAGVRRVLYLCVPLGVLFASVGGYILARRNLEPIVAMTGEVNRITSQNLHQRLAVANANDELGQLAGTFNELLGRLNRSFDDQRRFMADASHELRTPLSVALTAAQVNLEGAPRTTEEYREALRIVTEQLRRLKRIVQDMFLLAQVDSGAFEPAIAPFYLEEVAAEAVRAARVIAEPLGVSVRFPPVQDCTITADEGLIRQLLLALLDNAIRHTPPGGSVTVSLAPDGEDWQLDIIDTGTGIPEADQPHIFDRFYRVSKARTRQAGGSGLGLSIAQWIAALHGGSLRLLSSGPGGTAFRIRLPKERRGLS